jgi:CheY-like chemotaxis protein
MTARVLIVEDELNVRLMLRTALESAECAVEEAANGREAMQAMERHLPDLVLLDLSMPVMDGMAVLLALHERPRAERPRVVVLTAYGSIPAAVEAMRLGALDFVEKPITPELLRTTVESALRQPLEEAAVESCDVRYRDLLAVARQKLCENDLSKTEEVLLRASALRSVDADFLNLVGAVHEAKGADWHLVKHFYARAVGADPNYEPAQENLRRFRHAGILEKHEKKITLGEGTYW